MQPGSTTPHVGRVFYVNKLSSGSIGRPPLTSTLALRGRGERRAHLRLWRVCCPFRIRDRPAEPLREAALEVLGLEVRCGYALVPRHGSVLVHYDHTRHLRPLVSLLTSTRVK